jgi:three-Cys-motif partner protein
MISARRRDFLLAIMSPNTTELVKNIISQKSKKRRTAKFKLIATKPTKELQSDVQGDDYIMASDGLLARKSGKWAKRKHHYLGNYCGITTKAMRNKFKLVYVDVMAGPGRCKRDDNGEEFPGSPLVALEHDFSQYILIEDDPALAQALRARVASHPKARKIEIIEDSWIKVLNSGRLKFDEHTLVVAFVDPTGISQIPLSAVRKLGSSPKIDLLVTIQYRLGIVWNVPQYFKSTSGQTVLDNFLEEQTWRRWNDKDPTEFGRLAVELFCNKLKKERFIGTRHIPIPEDNPFYRFTLFTRHPCGEDFWHKVMKIDEKGQRELL